MSRNLGLYRSCALEVKGFFQIRAGGIFSDTSVVQLGSITSRCSGNEPALFPRTRPDSRKQRKSSLSCNKLLINYQDSQDGPIFFHTHFSFGLWSSCVGLICYSSQYYLWLPAKITSLGPSPLIVSPVTSIRYTAKLSSPCKTVDVVSGGRITSLGFSSWRHSPISIAWYVIL